MKRILVFIVFFAFISPGVVFAHSYWGTDKAPVEGENEWYYEDGTIKSQATYNKDMKLEGAYKNYYPDGALAQQTYYKNGIIDGPSKLYWPDESVKSSQTYQNGKQIGTSKSFHENGNLRVIMHYNKHGKPHGENIIYLENGKEKHKSNFVNGVRQGPFRSYYNSGKLFQKGQYKDGNYDGRITEYYETGELMYERDCGIGEDGEFLCTSKKYSLKGDLIWAHDGRKALTQKERKEARKEGELLQKQWSEVHKK